LSVNANGTVAGFKLIAGGTNNNSSIYFAANKFVISGSDTAAVRSVQHHLLLLTVLPILRHGMIQQASIGTRLYL
ncbi:hypothetical protein ACPX2E_004130, partial [Escherichia coli]